MADSFISSQMTPPLPAASPQPLQRELLESARQFSAEASQFAYEWQGAWPDQAVACHLDVCVEAIRMVIDRLVAEFGRVEGPAETEVAGLIGALLGTTEEPGPFRRMQALTRSDEGGGSPEQQKLLSEVEVLRIQFHALRAQWQDYLSLLTARRRDTDAFSVVPKKRRRRISEYTWRQLRETLTICATLGGVLLVLISLGYLAVTHLPGAQNPPATTPAPPLTTAPALSASNPTSTPQPIPTAPSTSTPFVPPTATLAPQPTATTPSAPGLAQLTVNPPVLLVPCPGVGAGTLQLVNTSTQPLRWTAHVSSLSGGNPGIALDVAQGSLEADGVAFINVTALAQSAQGTITIASSGAGSPASVAYTVSC